MENPETSSNQQKPEDGDKHDDRPRNRIQVSREKRPLNFYIGLAKKFLANEDVVELSGLGMAVTTVVTVAEILKASGSVKIDRKSIHALVLETTLWRSDQSSVCP